MSGSGILAIDTNQTGQIGLQAEPRRCTMITQANLAAVTAPGFLDAQNKSGNPVLPTDVWEIIYNYNIDLKTFTFGIFTVSYNVVTASFTLVPWVNPSNVLLPVVSGNLPIFDGTTGQLQDSGAAFHMGTTNVYAGGATSNAFTVAGITASSKVVCTNLTTTNAVSIVKAVPGAGTLTVTWSADPGAGTTVNYAYSSAAF